MAITPRNAARSISDPSVFAACPFCPWTAALTPTTPSPNRFSLTPLANNSPKPYVAPSRRRSREYTDDHHPRMVDVRTGLRRPFPVVRARMGRHCFACCRRFDPFREGLDSWFTEFGVGVTLCVTGRCAAQLCHKCWVKLNAPCWLDRTDC